MKKLTEKEDYYSMTFNTDGVIVHGSSKSSLWPVILACNFLPPNIRFKEKNLIVCALFYGAEKPKFAQYLSPLIDEFKDLSENGIIVNSECFKIIISHASLDLPAKSAMQQIVQYNGYNSCYYCHYPGEKTVNGVRYTFRTQPYALRNHSEIYRF